MSALVGFAYPGLVPPRDPPKEGRMIYGKRQGFSVVFPFYEADKEITDFTAECVPQGLGNTRFLFSPDAIVTTRVGDRFAYGLLMDVDALGAGSHRTVFSSDSGDLRLVRWLTVK